MPWLWVFLPALQLQTPIKPTAISSLLFVHFAAMDDASAKGCRGCGRVWEVCRKIRELMAAACPTWSVSGSCLSACPCPAAWNVREAWKKPRFEVCRFPCERWCKKVSVPYIVVAGRWGPEECCSAPLSPPRSEGCFPLPQDWSN